MLGPKAICRRKETKFNIYDCAILDLGFDQVFVKYSLLFSSFCVSGVSCALLINVFYSQFQKKKRGDIEIFELWRRCVRYQYVQSRKKPSVLFALLSIKKCSQVLWYNWSWSSIYVGSFHSAADEWMLPIPVLLWRQVQPNRRRKEGGGLLSVKLTGS